MAKLLQAQDSIKIAKSRLGYVSSSDSSFASCDSSLELALGLDVDEGTPAPHMVTAQLTTRTNTRFSPYQRITLPEVNKQASARTQVSSINKAVCSVLCALCLGVQSAGTCCCSAVAPQPLHTYARHAGTNRRAMVSV
jgi:hypothetical protein